MTTIMYDDVTLDLIPPNPPAVAAYVDGRFANIDEARRRFPHAIILPICVSSSTDAAGIHIKEEALDDEPGDATNATAVPWTRRQLAKGRIPVLYTSASNVAALVATLTAAGISRDRYLIWSAHFTNVPHICGPHTCGFPQADATQFTDRALGRSLDESLCSDHFLPRATPPRPPADSGAARANVIVHLQRKENVWEVRGEPAPVHFGGPDEYLTAEVGINLRDGSWRIHNIGRKKAH